MEDPLGEIEKVNKQKEESVAMQQKMFAQGLNEPFEDDDDEEMAKDITTVNKNPE